MYFFNWSFLALLSVFSLGARGVALTTHSAPDLSKRVPNPRPVPYPYGLSHINEMLYTGYDPQDPDHKEIASRLHDGFKDMVGLAKVAYDEANRHGSDIFNRWFDEQDAEGVKSVFSKITDPATALATPLMREWQNNYDDFGDQCRLYPRPNAYTDGGLGEWHMCRPKGQFQPQDRDLQCANIDGYASARMRSVAMSMLHEAMHWIRVGDPSLGGRHIRDWDSTSYGCFRLNREYKLTNAQNYAFFAAEAHFRVKNCPLQDPPVGTESADDSFYDIELGKGSATPGAPDQPAPLIPLTSDPNSLALNPGTCCFHLMETELGCAASNTENLLGNVTLVDDKKQIIGQTETSKDKPGEKMDAGNPYHFKNNKLKNDLIITGEHWNDYVRFTIGKLSWTSREPNGGASCTVGGWDPRHGARCEKGLPRNAVNNMNCCFPCDKDT